MDETKFLTTVSELVPRVGRMVKAQDNEIAVFLLSDNEIAALENFNPLTKGPIVDGTVSGEFLYEPMRDYKISLKDGTIQDDNAEGIQIRTFPVEVAEGRVYLKG